MGFVLFAGSLLLAAPALAQTFRVCHGYGCYYRTKLTLSASDRNRIRNTLQKGRRTADAERMALQNAIAFFERRGTSAIGVRDKPRMQFGKARIKGQMDCIDESTNTDAFLRYIQSQGWLKYHTVARRTSRGAFFDGRYPHWTAVIEDKQGERWAVDSWYEAGGGKPDIMPLREWKRRGYGGQR
ncbi:hypothetical protein FHS76_002512 [Ochrobactrum daejeonense]|uniref:Uncharacterized protein n=1 Tax=Brucella daejeonensis TaxID=659015 RepID=A0A7W9ELP1_9HYPH|nr:hypothetical protein [Brucella daejeonensis]MBB5702628.1 hypothetical protein [Brucella daejeonensis]